MSSIAVTASATGAGVITLAAPVTATNRTLTLPDSTDTLQTVGGVLSQFNASGSAPVYACRAWVNFNGTGTVAIRASGNVSSITDNGVGDYTVNFTTAMPDANYAPVITYSQDYGVARCAGAQLYLNGSSGAESVPTTSAARFVTTGATANFDAKHVCVSIFR